jgi:predicted dehydrogenase
MDKVRWGVLGAADIATKKVIPAMQKGQYCDIRAIASRDLNRAQAVAKELGIARAHGSYEELLSDPDVDAVYIPLPNNLHVSWSIKAIEAGKHVLCEKPIAMSAAEARELLASAQAHPKLKVMEAFMYRFHPQWQTAKRLVDEGQLGELRAVQSFLAYHNMNPRDVRNRVETGGGGLMDIGCYGISIARFIFGAEPRRVFGIVELDPSFHTDRMASGILAFAHGTGGFTCATQLYPTETARIVGHEGMIEVEVALGAPLDRPARIRFYRGGEVQEMLMPICNHYTLQGDAFSRAVLDDSPVPTPLSDAVANMEVIEAVRRSSDLGGWV